MSRQRRVWTVAVSGAVVWLLAVVFLGTRWAGIDTGAGGWQDAVALRRWAWFWAATVLAGGGLGGWLRSWSMRLWSLGPPLLWLFIELRHGSLWPVAWLIYAAPTAAAWLAGALFGDLIRWRLARGVKHPAA